MNDTRTRDGLGRVPRGVHETATRGWDEDELRQLARMWAEQSATTTDTESR